MEINRFEQWVKKWILREHSYTDSLVQRLVRNVYSYVPTMRTGQFNLRFDEWNILDIKELLS